MGAKRTNETYDLQGERSTTVPAMGGETYGVYWAWSLQSSDSCCVMILVRGIPRVYSIFREHWVELETEGLNFHSTAQQMQEVVILHRKGRHRMLDPDAEKGPLNYRWILGRHASYDSSSNCVGDGDTAEQQPP